MDLVLKCVLLILLILQIITMSYMLYSSIQQHKASKKFWREIGDTIKNTMNKYNDLVLGDSNEEDNK